MINNKIYDVITFNCEHDMFEIRYNILKEYVDEFIVVEFDKTFSGKPKESTFKYQNWPKVKYFLITEDIWSKYIEDAKKSPNTEYGKGAEHWIREWAMKESIKDCLTHLNDDDICFIGDVDEIPDLTQSYDLNSKLRLKVYTYWINNRSSEEFGGTIFTDYKTVKESCLNHLRVTLLKTSKESGWHFTSLRAGLRQKLTDSYTSESYATDEVLDNLEDNVENNRDFLGRNFIYETSDVDLPQFIKDNKERYKHLWKN